MKKLDKKGFFSIAIIYSFLILFILLLLAIISSYLNRFNLLNSLIDVAQEEASDSIELIKPVRNEVVSEKDKPGFYTITLDAGRYQMELWGAQGGSSVADGNVSYRGGYGSYTNAEIEFKEKTTIYVYVGGKGKMCHSKGTCDNTGGYNGGGKSIKNTATASHYGSGGGATDIRIGGKDIGDRVMIAGGGGGAANVGGSATSNNYIGGNATGFGFKQSSATYGDGTQTAHGAGGKYDAENEGSYPSTPNTFGPGGGGGFYGGGTSSTQSYGGSSYISGYNNCSKASLCAEPKEVSFENGILVDGSGYGWRITNDTVTVSAKQRIPLGPNEGNDDDDEYYYELGLGKNGDGAYRISKIDKQRIYYNTNTYQTFVAPRNGEYKFELWGAQGGSVDDSRRYPGAYGGYTSGRITLKKGDTLYLFVGGQGTTTKEMRMLYPNSYNAQGGYNGGQSVHFTGLTACPGHDDLNGICSVASGGGATDIRTYIDDDGNWNNSESLRSRIMVAAGGAGGSSNSPDPDYEFTGGYAGGIEGYAGSTVHDAYKLYFGPGSTILNNATGGTQTNGGKSVISSNTDGGVAGTGVFGGKTGNVGLGPLIGSGAGGGYYTGGAGKYKAGGGGSSFISGHTGCVSVNDQDSNAPRTGTNGAACVSKTTDRKCSEHYAKIPNQDGNDTTPAIFTYGSTIMIDGQGFEWTNTIRGIRSMPNPYKADFYALGNGHAGNGVIRITLPDAEDISG